MIVPSILSIFTLLMSMCPQIISLYSSVYLQSKMQSISLLLAHPHGVKSMIRDRKVSDKECLEFSRDGHIQIKQLFDQPEISIQEKLRTEILQLFEDDDIKLKTYQHKVHVMLGRDDSQSMSLQECQDAMSEIYQEKIPFLQLFNIWRSSPTAHSLVHSPILGNIAAKLLGVKSVRVYQDSVFMKRSGDGPTLWHSDLNMCPFDTNDFLTCWIPLQDVPNEVNGGTGLTFATRSHRDFALPYWSEVESCDLSSRYLSHSYPGYTVGDCSFHHGWCLHSAPGNTGDTSRYAYSISYVADGAPLLQEEGHIRYPDLEDYQSYEDWIDEVGWGGTASHPLMPLVYKEVDEDNDKKLDLD